jgi:hypothetical protein
LRTATVRSKTRPVPGTRPSSAPRRGGAHKRPVAASPGLPGAKRARRKFLRAFPGGFRDETYVDWERAYKWSAHLQWREALDETAFRALLAEGRYREIAQSAIRIESRTNLLFSFEKMALRDAVHSPKGARGFATALFELLHGTGSLEDRFTGWTAAIEALPRRQTRVLTWPLVTVFGFIAQPQAHFFFKPTVTREAARRYGAQLPYASRPSWDMYNALLQFVGTVRADIRDLKPRDMIDLQSFLWVQGSDEYPD